MNAKRLFSWVCLAISSTLFAGFLPGWILGKPGKAGGTAGSVVALIGLYALLDVRFFTVWALMIGSFFIGWAACGPGEQLMLDMWGARKRHTGETVTGDFNETCIDEVHGLFLSALPLWYWTDWVARERLVLLGLAFILFRICDTLKPWPIGWIERRFKDTTFGIMIDDTVAGLVPLLVIAVYHTVR